jgi:hypothetical protein
MPTERVYLGSADRRTFRELSAYPDIHRREQRDISNTGGSSRPDLHFGLENLQSAVSLSSSLLHQCAHLHHQGCAKSAKSAKRSHP